MYDLCYEVDLLYGHQGQTLYQGTKVLSYKIKYYLPYLGLAADISRKNWGLGMNIKYSFHPTAKDVDNHLLRGLTFFGDYDKHGEALMGNVNAFLKINKNCKLKMGLDATFIRIDGITWEDLRDPGWDKDQSTDARHWIFWSGVEYKF
jgi:outer membrane protease